MPTELSGNWSSIQRISMRHESGFMQYRFRSDSVLLQISISSGGIVTGHIGCAELQNCKVKSNRGWIGRHLHLATDYIIEGTLVGAIFQGDTIQTKNISAPFDMKNDSITGTMFHKLRFDMYPIAAFNLVRHSDLSSHNLFNELPIRKYFTKKLDKSIALVSSHVTKFLYRFIEARYYDQNCSCYFSIS
ncbi:MAG: hypothetical protein LWX56_11910 [Ignavibacteria bacterium]|nr:hypothetical protein [Ignavibacteria bacterium]